MKKLTNILLKIFAIGVIVCLFAGCLSLVGYISALIIGGELATSICSFIFTVYFPWVIKLTSLFTGIGLVGMYLSKKKALTVNSDAA